ncbi:MAG: hypothetical protein EBZ05_06230 [Verrucomicrobia bacterium]|nr:hypothetical protein [Verrucomicrobiota bacterium]
MPRKLRIEYPGAHYHVMGRANDGRPIFTTDYQHELFLKALGEACEAFHLQVRSYVLMPNHYHLLVSTPAGNISQAIGWLLTAFTVRYNKSHQRIGHVFQGRFKAQIIDDRGYARTLIPYLHLNPIRSRIDGKPRVTGPPELMETFLWSSHACYTGRRQPPPWLNLDWLAFWGEASTAHASYRAEIHDLIQRTTIPDPWVGLKDGFILAEGSELLEIRRKLNEREKYEGIRLRQNRPEENRDAFVKKLAAELEDVSLRLWLLSRFTGDLKTKIARDHGLKSTSAMSSRVKYLLKKAEELPELKQKMQQLEQKVLRYEVRGQTLT